MRIKFIAIYLLAGAAFLGVSLWAFLSNGKSARAVRAKYRLGGIMLTAWTMFSSASCEGVVPQVTCYDTPQVTCYEPAIQENDVVMMVKDFENQTVRPGESIEFMVYYPTYQMFKCCIFAGETEEAPLIQEFEYLVPDDNQGEVRFSLELAATEYKGKALVQVKGMRLTPDGTHQPEWESLPCCLPFLNIL